LATLGLVIVMKLLKESLETAIKELGKKDQDTIDRLFDLIERMSADLEPAVKKDSDQPLTGLKKNEAA